MGRESKLFGDWVFGPTLTPKARPDMIEAIKAMVTNLFLMFHRILSLETCVHTKPTASVFWSNMWFCWILTVSLPVGFALDVGRGYIGAMSEFNKICKEFEQLDVLSYVALLGIKSKRILPALIDITQDGETGVEIFASFIIGAIAADGRLSETEYELLSPLLHAFFGEELDYETCKKAFRKMAPEQRELKKSVDEMVDVLGLLSDDLKDDIITVCLLICAVDGKVSLRERNWIKQLIK